ncbi:MAG TPA: Calx-beta domain-containing protein [Gemmataceae bacterium]|nr:Calx-beta domain-containing protein [Gemmataceae bacterium]
MGSGGGLVLENTVLSGNSAATSGGGLFWTGTASATPPAGFTASTLVIKNATFAQNVAGSALGGGLSASVTGTLLVQDSTFFGNRAGTTGGGLNFATGTLTVQNSTFDSNQATGAGGGIAVTSGTAATVVGSALTNNTTVASGGGIGVTATGTTTLAVQNSTLAGNTAAVSGGGIGVTAGSGAITVTNATIVGNTANATAANTGGGGIARTQTTAGTLNVQNSIVAGNTAAAPANGPDIVTGATGSTVNVNFSAIGTSTGFTPSGTSGNNIAAGTNLMLADLANYGGATRTISLVAGSPLIDAGSNALVPGTLTTDQRGGAFARQAGTVDIGAVEAQAPFLPGAFSAPSNVTVAGGTTYTFTVTFADPTGPNTGIKTAGIMNNNGLVRIAGPGGFDVAATYVSIDNAADGTPRTATYSFTPPGGAWDGIDNGLYTVRVLGGQVQDADDNFLVGGPVGTFRVQTSYVVTTPADSGPGSFREALTGAGFNPFGDTITFDPTVFGTVQTISLLTALPTIPAAGGALTVTGPGAGLLTVRRDPAAAANFRLLDSATTALTLTGLRLTGGQVTGSGGALNVGGTTALAVLDGVTIEGNSATSTGGAIFVGSGNFLNLKNTTVSGNVSGSSGGGIYFTSGGGLFADGIVLSNNIAATTGGGLTWLGTASTTPPAGFFAAAPVIGNSVIEGNSAGGNGGAIHLSTLAAGGTFIVANSFVGGNSSRGSGGAFHSSSAGGLAVANSTVVGNTALASGGAIGVTSGAGTVTVLNSTIFGNTAGATAANTGGGGIGRTTTTTGTVDVINSVIAGNTNANGPDILTAATGSTVNLYFSAVGNATGYTASGASTGNIPAGTDLKLGPLANYGGATRVMGLLPGSPLLEAGNAALLPTTPAPLPNDQRGAPFVRTVGALDIGAVESQAPFLPVAFPTTPALTGNPSTYSFTVTFADPTGGNNGVQTAGIVGNNGLVRVTGPNGFDQFATYVSIDNAANGTPRTATYTITAPGGTWDGLENGRYAITLTAGQVKDLDDNFAAGGVIGTFKVSATYIVTTTADSGPGSLREALVRANTDPVNDVIAFDPAVFGTAQTIALQTALPQVPAAGGNLTVTGPGRSLLTVQRDPAAATQFRVLDTVAAETTLTGLTVSGGSATSDGGGISASGFLTLDGVAVTGNTTTTDGGGVNINSGGFLSIRNSVVSGNSAGGDGGGIYFFSGGGLVMENTLVSGNFAGGTAQGGGGLYWFGTASAAPPAGFTPSVVVVTNSAFVNNSTAGSGGGIVIPNLTGEVTLTNTTFANNAAATDGGAVNNKTAGTVNFENATLIGNTAAGNGGGFNATGGVANFDNTIVSGNTAPTGPDIGGAATLNVNNSAVGDTTGLTISGANNLAPGTNLLLGPLGDYGGPTPSFAPQPGSPLINAGAASLVPTGVTTDQRGAPFVRQFGAEVDIGAFEVQPPAVTVNQAADQADPTNGDIRFTVTFAAPVTGFTAGDVLFTGSTAPGTLVPIVTGSGANYTVTVSGMAGNGTVVVSVPANAAVDGSQTGNSASTSTDNTVTFDNVAPTVTINQAAGQADPTAVGPLTFNVLFSEPVFGFTAADIDLSESTVGGTLVPTVTGSGAAYTVTVSGMNGTGTVVAKVAVAGATDAAGNGNLASTSTDNTVLFDNRGPIVTINQGATQADPTNGAIVFDVQFDEPVFGFTASDIDFTGSTAGGTPVVAIGGAGPNYTVTVTGLTSSGTLVANIPAGAVADGLGNSSSASTSTDNTVTFDNVAPSVTIDQAVGQPDPTNGPVVFDVHFSEPMAGFTADDISFAGTTIPGTPTVVIGGSGADYTVTVTGLTGEGLVVASIPAGAVTDLAGNPVAASTSTDNSVFLDNVVPTVTISQAAGQPDPVAVGPIVFDVVFNEPVTGFNTVDTSASTVGGTLSAVITGSGANYQVTVTGMTGTGTVVVSVPAGVVIDQGGNPNPPSTGDGTVLFDTIGQLQFSAATYTATETDAFATVTVTRTDGSANALTVNYATSNGSATAGADYTATSGTLSWANGDTTPKTISIPLSDDRLVEGLETILLTLSNPTGGATLGTQTTATVNVADFEEGDLAFGAPVFSANEDGSTVATVTVTRVNGSDGAVSVNYATSDGTATAGADYTATSGTLSWAAGDSTPKTFTIPVLDDQLVEGTETVDLTLSGPTGNSVLGAQGTATLNIVDIEEGVLQFSDPTFFTDEDGVTTASVTVTRTDGTDGDVTIDYAFTAGTAIAGVDYTGIDDTLIIPHGAASGIIEVPILPDDLNEGRETLTLTLSNPGGNARLGTQTTATLTINPSDGKVIAPADKKATFTDELGDIATVKFGGTKTGTVTVYLTDTDGNGKGEIELITVAGTEPAAGKAPTATVTVTAAKPKGGTGDGFVTIGGVTGSALKAFTAAKSDLVGDGIAMTGFVGAVTVKDVKAGADILLPAAPPTAKSVVKVTAQKVEDGSDVTVVAAPIGTLKAWTFGDGTITAPSIATVSITGAKKPVVVAGDFEGDVVVTGVGLPAGKTALNAMTVAGTFAATASVTTPSLGKLTVKGDLAGDVTVTGPAPAATKPALKTLSVTGTVADTAAIVAPSIGSMSVKKDLFGDVTVSGTGVATGKAALGTLSVTGVVDGSTIDVTGNVTGITAGTFKDSFLYAGYDPTTSTFGPATTVGSFKVTGKTAGFANSYLYAGTFNNVTLASLVPDNAGTDFGVFADTLVKAASVPAFGFKYLAGVQESIGDFKVLVI